MAMMKKRKMGEPGRAAIGLTAVLLLAATVDRASGEYAEPGRTDAAFDPTRPLLVGAREEVGAEGTTRKIGRGLLGGLARRAGVGSSGSAPGTLRDPARRLDFVDGDSGSDAVRAGARAILEAHGTLLISQRIQRARDHGTFHDTFLVDCHGNRIDPVELEIYGLWAQRGLSVSWSRTRSVDGRVIDRQSGGWSRSDAYRVEGERVASDARADDAGSNRPGIWAEFGSDRAYGGIRHLGARYALSDMPARDWLLVTHITLPKEDPVTTRALAWRLSGADPGADLQPELAVTRVGKPVDAWTSWRDTCTAPSTPGATIGGASHADPWQRIRITGPEAKLHIR